MTEDTIPKMFQERVKKYGYKTALMAKREGKYRNISWNEFGEIVKNFSLGLSSLGIKKGDTVAIASLTRAEWAYSDFGILCAGGITVTIYPSDLPPEFKHILNDSDSRMIVVENEEQLAKVLEIRKDLPKLEKIIVIEKFTRTDDGMIISFEEVCELGRKLAEEKKNLFEETLISVTADDVATYVYTSGTTGPPKGTVITQRNIMFVVHSLEKVLPPFGEGEKALSFLPLAHVYERIGGQFTCLYMGVIVAYAESLDTIAENMREVRPNMVLGAPRLYEKAYAAVLAAVEEGSALKKAIFNWSVRIGREVSRRKQSQQHLPLWTRKIPPIGLWFRSAIANRLVFHKIAQRFGGNMRFFVSAAAPLSKEIIEFFHALGILILEGYGLTETTAPACVNRWNKYKFGTVGPPLPGVEIKIADDGEILIKGENVFQGYYKNPEQTRETLKDGWLYTGDIGKLDSEGFLTITDRKKDIIITAGGKNIAPQNIENHLKTDRYINEVMVIGDRRKYLSALLTLDPEAVEYYAKENRLSYKDFSDLMKKPEIHNLILERIEEKNKGLARHETIKKFTILETQFSQETGEVTPTLKVKRNVVTKKYKHLIDAMYDEDQMKTSVFELNGEKNR